MTTSNRTLRRLIATASALDPEDRALVIRALLGEDGLMGAIEASEALGVLQPNLRPIPQLPDAVQKLRSGSVWLSDEIRPLAERRRSKSAAA